MSRPCISPVNLLLYLLLSLIITFVHSASALPALSAGSNGAYDVLVSVDLSSTRRAPSTAYLTSSMLQGTTPSNQSAFIDLFRETRTGLMRDTVGFYFQFVESPGIAALNETLISWSLHTRYLTVFALGGQILLSMDGVPQYLSDCPPPQAEKCYPTDLAQWGTFVSDFATLIISYYPTIDPSRIWYEVWNEPDASAVGFIHQSVNVSMYNTLYNVTSRAVKQAAPTSRIGGPVLAALHDQFVIDLYAVRTTNWMYNFLVYVAASTVPLDFVCWHEFSWNPLYHLQHFSQNDVALVRRFLTDLAIPFASSIPILWSEWNVNVEQTTTPTTQNRQYNSDSERAAAYAVMGLYWADRLGLAYNVWAMIGEVDTGLPEFHGGQGFFTANAGFRKSTLNAHALVSAQVLGRSILTGVTTAPTIADAVTLASPFVTLIATVPSATGTPLSSTYLYPNAASDLFLLVTNQFATPNTAPVQTLYRYLPPSATTSTNHTALVEEILPRIAQPWSTISSAGLSSLAAEILARAQQVDALDQTLSARDTQVQISLTGTSANATWRLQLAYQIYEGEPNTYRTYLAQLAAGLDEAQAVAATAVANVDRLALHSDSITVQADSAGVANFTIAVPPNSVLSINGSLLSSSVPSTSLPSSPALTSSSSSSGLTSTSMPAIGTWALALIVVGAVILAVLAIGIALVCALTGSPQARASQHRRSIDYTETLGQELYTKTS